MAGDGQRLWEALLLGVPPTHPQSEIAGARGAGGANEGDSGRGGVDEVMLQHTNGGGGGRTSAATPATVQGTFRSSPEVEQALDSTSNEGGEAAALEALLVEAFQVRSRFRFRVEGLCWRRCWSRPCRSAAETRAFESLSPGQCVMARMPLAMLGFQDSKANVSWPAPCPRAAGNAGWKCVLAAVCAPGYRYHL